MSNQFSSKPRSFTTSNDRRERVRATKIFKEGGKGRKQCENCLVHIGGPSKVCPNCGHKFKWARQIKSSDTIRVKDMFARRENLIDRINEISDRKTIEELIDDVENKLGLQKNTQEILQNNFEISNISKSIVDRPFIRILNFSIELSWKINKLDKKYLFEELFLKTLKGTVHFLVEERKLLISMVITKTKDTLESEVETESDTKQELLKEEKIINHLLNENNLIESPIKLIEEIEVSYKKNQTKKIKAIGWNWTERDEDFIKRYCSINSIMNEINIDNFGLGDMFDCCEN